MNMNPSTGAAPLRQPLPSALESTVVLRPSGSLLPSERDAMAFASWPAFTASGFVPLGFYLDGWDAPALVALCESIRHSPWWDRPIWASESSAPPPAWADAAGPLSEAIAAGERALAARRSLKLDPSGLHFDERVLYFMYLRDGAKLTPLCDRNSAQLYRYPLVEALAHEGDDVAACLATLSRRRLLEPAELIDRTHPLPGCVPPLLQHPDQQSPFAALLYLRPCGA